MLRTRLIVACGLLLSPAIAEAASGLSDIAATRACWVRAPYAGESIEWQGCCRYGDGRDAAVLPEAAVAAGRLYRRWRTCLHPAGTSLVSSADRAGDRPEVGWKQIITETGSLAEPAVAPDRSGDGSSEFDISPAAATDADVTLIWHRPVRCRLGWRERGPCRGGSDRPGWGCSPHRPAVPLARRDSARGYRTPSACRPGLRS